MEIKQTAKTILVTGGTGFIGAHLVDELVKQKKRVIVTFLRNDPNSYFSAKKLHRQTIMALCDLSDMQMMSDIVTRYSVDTIIHLGAQSVVDVAYQNPLRTIQSNIMGTANVLECARLYPHIRAVIVASSDKAYGKTKKEKYHETDPLVGDHPYEVSKSSADLLCKTYHKTYQVPVVVTRFGNIYGEGDLHVSRIIPGALHALITKRPLQIRSDGTYVRDYVYVKDVVRGYLHILHAFSRCSGGVFNFGSEETLSVLDLLALMKAVFKRSVPYVIRNTAHNEIPYQSLDYSLIKKTIGWKPRFTLAKTLPRMLRWYRGYFKSVSSSI